MSNPTLASITAELEAVETAARGRGSLTCDHLAGRIANIRGELQQIAQPHPPAEAQPLTGDPKILWGVVANAGRLSGNSKYRWSHVIDATGQGSQSSIALCHRFGFDPDERVGGHDDDESDDGAEAQPVGEVKLHGGLLYGQLDRDLPQGTKIYAHPPPSAPVGVTADILRIVNTAIDVCNDRDRPAMAEDLEAVRIYVEQASAALAHQPATVTQLERSAVSNASAPVGVEAAAIERAIAEIESGDFDGGVSDACLQAMKAAIAQQPAAVECPYRTRCDCLCSCKYGMAGDGALAAQQGGAK